MRLEERPRIFLTTGNLEIGKATHTLRTLVPGAGLGRLVFEICAAGYRVEGNEISYHQLLASNYMLNHVYMPGQHKLYPWALNFSNNTSRSNQLQHVAVPDICPGDSLEWISEDQQSEVHYSNRMTMTSGDFCVLYRQLDLIETRSISFEIRNLMLIELQRNDIISEHLFER